MKKMLILAVTALLLSHSVRAQCPANVVYTVSKMEMLDSALQVTRTKDITASVSTSGTNIMVHKSATEGDTMAGPIKKATCNWTEPYKNGKIVITADIQDGQDELKGATITIEAINGKVTILLHAAEHADNLIRLYVEKYEVTPKQ